VYFVTQLRRCCCTRRCVTTRIVINLLLLTTLCNILTGLRDLGCDPGCASRGERKETEESGNE